MNIHHILKTASAPLALSAAMVAVPVFAQGSDEPVQIADASDDVILVTGSRIAANPQVSSANPIVIVDAETIQRSGETNLTDLLAQTPALFNSVRNFDAAGSRPGIGAAGINLLNLRNLGAERTLVLVDGRRHVSGSAGEAGVDINTIPVSLIDRIDVLTGGVSSVYGADGVSGVVNFVMKRDFEGIEARGQYGVSDFGDADSYFGSITAGTNFSGGRGNIAAAYEYRRDERVRFEDRPNGRFDSLQLVRNPADVPDDPALPDNILLPFIGFADSSVDGALVIDSSFIPAFRGGGQPYNGGTFLPSSGFLSTGSPTTSDTPVANFPGDLQAQTEHHTINLLASYELTPAITFFAEGKYVRTQTSTSGQPSFDFFTFVSNDNPFIPQNVRDAVDTFGEFGGVLLTRDNFDLGLRGEDLERDVLRGVVGFEGDLSDNATFEISYVYGRNQTGFTATNNRIQDRYFAALDAVDEGAFLTGIPNGNVVCRTSVDGSGIVDAGNFNFGQAPQTFTPDQCAPINLFGEGVASQAALDFVLTDLQNEYTITQHVVNGFVSGDFGKYFELPGGPVSFAIGAEYRDERSASVFDPIARQATDFDSELSVLADFPLVANEVGSFDVKEVFAELALPILADVPNAELLELKAAVRLSDYSTTGFADSWSVSGIWAPMREVSFRGNYSKATRAPNINELFSPNTGTFDFVTDPCDPDTISSGTSFRAANCAALINGLGADFATFDFSSSMAASASIPGRISGNRDIDQEEATTWTAGLVLRPAYAPGLTLTFDWYDIRIEDAINTASVTELAAFCVDSPTLDNQFCDLVQRENGTGFVNGFQLQPFNVAFFETAGFDVTLGYSFEAGAIGQFDVRGALGYLDKLLFVPSNGGEIDDDRGEVNAPKWSGTGDVTWRKDAFSLNYGVQYVGPQLRFGLAALAANPDIAAPEIISFSDRFIHDIQGEIAIADDKLTLYGGINNFTNELPDAGSILLPTGWRGRYFYSGLRLRFDSLGL